MKYQIQVNNGNANLGITQKTITANEVNQVISNKFLAEECHHENPLVPVQVIESVLSNFSKTAARLMAEGMAIQLMDGNNVMMRIYADIHVKGDNINLARAKELDPAIQTEADMIAKAGELVSKTGVSVRARCEAEQKFTELLLDQKTPVQRIDGIKEVAFVPASDGSGQEEEPQGNSPAPDNGGSNGGSGGFDTGD